MCFSTSVVLDAYVNDGSTDLGCYRTRCSGGVFEVGITEADSTVTWIACDGMKWYGIAVFATPSSSGIDSGAIVCPADPALLCDPHACPNLPCDGTDQCVAGVCLCGDAFGVACIAPPPNPPTPPPSPSPPPNPPADPGAAYKSVVAFSLTVVGSVDSFDAAALKVSLVALLDFQGIAAGDVTLELSSGSVVVSVSVVAPSAAAAAAAASTISSASAASLSMALGVTVTAVTAPTISIQLFNAPPPMPPSAPPPMPPSLDDLLLSAGVAAGVAAALVVAWLLYRYCRRVKAKKAANTTGVSRNV